MTYTPGEIRAAEYVNSRDVCGTAGDDHDVDRQWTDSAGIVADTILRHRADYDAEGMPLPVDEAWCKSIGMEVGHFASFTKKNNFRAMHVTVDFPIGTVMVYVLKPTQNELQGGMCLGSLPRPQLRALIEVMG